PGSRRRYRSTRVTDIALFRSSRRHRQITRRDVRRGAGRGVTQNVIPSVSAADRDPTHTHVLASAHVLVRKARSRVAVRKYVTRDDLDRTRHSSIDGAVTSLVA